MKAKKATIFSMGRMPRNESISAQLQFQIEWLLKLELSLQDIFYIEQNVNMERDAYGPDLVDMVHNLFHFEVQKDFTTFNTNDDKDRLSSIFNYILKMRSQRQLMLSSCELHESGSDTDLAYSDDEYGECSADREDTGDGDRQVDPGGGVEA